VLVKEGGKKEAVDVPLDVEELVAEVVGEFETAAVKVALMLAEPVFVLVCVPVTLCVVVLLELTDGLLV
jgi:hypothetical protein